MARPTILLFGFVAYVIFFATFLYLIAFVGELPWVPLTVDRGGVVGPITLAIAVNLALIAVFGLQHSVMARPAFKRAWTKVVPEPVERSVYVLAASLTLIALFAFWRPIATPIWTVTAPVGAVLLWALFGFGWLTVLLSTFLINHFELFGLSQVVRYMRGTPPGAPTFRTPFFYRLVRHPLYSGFIIAFFATPRMTVGHLLFACGMLGYILIAIRHEERDLTGVFGAQYEDYRTRVGMLVPRWPKRAS